MTQSTPASFGVLRRFLLPLFIVVAGFLAAAQARFASDPYFGDLYTTTAAGYAVAIVLIWFIFSWSYSKLVRWGGCAIALAALVGITASMGNYGDIGNMSPIAAHAGYHISLAGGFTVQDDRPPAKDLKLPAIDTTINEQSTVDLASIAPDDYPQFLGSTGHSLVHSPPLAEDWTADPPKKIWHILIGSGLSGFCTVGDYTVTQEQRSDQELVSCYQLSTAKLLWAHADKTRFSEGTAGDGPRATVTISDGKVYSMGATGILNCLDGRTGKVIWFHDIIQEHKQNRHGYGQTCSPLIFDNKVIVSLGDSATESLAAYDTATGTPLWVTGHDLPSYASPVVATLAGKKQIVTVNNNSVTGFDPDDGKVLWAYSWPGGTKCSQPIPLEPDRVFVSCSYGLGCAMIQIKSNSAGQFTVTELWKKPYLKTQYNNAVVRDSYVYGLDDGILCCVDLKTGALKWKNGRYGAGQVLLVNDLLLIGTDGGDFGLVRAIPQKTPQLTHFTMLSGRMWTSPSLSRGYLIVRVDGEASCFKLPFKTDTTTTAP